VVVCFAPDVAEAMLQQLTMLVTAEGNWVLPDSEEFLAALGDPQPDYYAVGFAVRNLGFVKFQVLDRLVTEIELCPRNVDLRAMLAVERLLIEAGTNLFRIRWLADDWQSEISASAKHTLVRLRELCAPVFEPVLTERFHVEAQDPDILFSQARRNEGLGPMAMKWRVSFGNFDTSIFEIAARHDLLERMAVAGFDAGDDRPVFRFIGGAHRWGGDKYPLDGLNRPIEQMPDREYGAWVSEFYKALPSTGQPRLDLVTVDMEYHAEAGKPHRKVTYERLLLPWRTSTGEPLVTSAVKLVSNTGANLRVAGSDSSSSRKVPKSS
jgi:hypothetical protein